MLFCYAEQAKNELLYWLDYLAKLPQDFSITPLTRTIDKTSYGGAMLQQGQTSKNVSVDPIYLKSPDSRFRNLLNPYILLSDFLSIFKAIKCSKPDVIVCFYMSHAYPLAVLKKILKFSLCVVAMGSDVNLENSLHHRLARKLIYRNCELIFARSRKLKETIKKECDCNIIVVPSSADTSFFRPLNSRTKLRQKWGINPSSQVILTVCRLDKNKGVDVLIRSLRELDSDDVNLLIVGEGMESKALRQLSSTLGIQETIKFLGFKSRDELRELYNLANVFALASYSEGLPRVLIEAMACECIPIVTNVGDVASVVSEAFNGFMVSPGDYEKFARKIREISSLSEEKIKLIQSRARRTVENDFDTRELIRRMFDSINAVCLSQNPSVRKTE